MDVANEVLGEIGIIRHPVFAVEFIPTLEALPFGLEMLIRQTGEIGGTDARHGADQDRGLHAFRMMCGQHAGMHAAQRQAHEDCVSRFGGVHDGQGVRHVVVHRIGRDIRRPVRLAVAAAVEGDAAEALAEIRQLRLVDPRMDDRPGRQEHHRFRAVAVDLVVDLDAVAIDKTAFAGQLCTHHVTFSTGRPRHRGRDRRPAVSFGG
jgi:hypothetical protein